LLCCTVVLGEPDNTCTFKAAEEKALVEWVIDNGGTVNAEVSWIDESYRGLIAKDDISKGKLIAAIPIDVVYPLDKNDQYEFEMQAVTFLRDRANSSGTFQPFWKALPPKAQTPLDVYSFPPDYMPLLQSDHLTKHIYDRLMRLGMFVRDFGGSLKEDAISDEDLTYALTMISTRHFAAPDGQGNLLIPVLDMANHKNNCPNKWGNVGKCPANKKKECLMFEAGEDIKKGEEICNSYGGMWNDRAFLDYGYLQHEAPPQLMGIDRHDFDPEADENNIWTSNNIFTTPPPEFTADSAEGYKKRVEELAKTLKALEDMDEEAAAFELATTDHEGDILNMVLQWRDARKAGIKVELERLENIIKEKEAAATS